MNKKVNIKTKPTHKPDVNNADLWVKNRIAEPSVKMKRLTIDVPEGLHRAIKAKTASNGVKMNEAIRVILEREYLNE